ncbi:programmed cell death protein 2-like [Oppia nitens]|uniref:programmed cell death protein 2-like n=1 Tax=Oppia nitens TaxID=1686743 RepID=UPI0023DA56FC|nr:programmed cell death protein 2-like [Oppia nitens]
MDGDSQVFIGIIDSSSNAEIDDQTSDFRANKIGGYPVLSPEVGHELVVHMKNIECQSCRRSLVFVSQIYCPIDESPDDRIIYLFVCPNNDCKQSDKWFAVRCVTPYVAADTSHKKQEAICDNNTDDWIDGQSDWGTDNTDIETINDTTANCSQSLSHLSLESNDRKSSSITDDDIIILKDQQYYRPFYLSVIDEVVADEKNDRHVKQLLESYEKTEGSSSCDKNGGQCSETFENSFLDTIYKNDRKNYQFLKRLSRCPQQVIRYQWMGSPLINSDSHRLAIPRCDLCGGDRVFEFQLMPALIRYLKPLSTENRDNHPDLDFATILIYSCLRNCNQKLSKNSIIFEHCILLDDPDNEK